MNERHASAQGAYGLYAEQVAGNGYAITPTVGKKPVKPNWPQAEHVPADVVRYKDCNLGVLTRRTPFFDVDVDHGPGAQAIDAMLAARGIRIRRYGRGYRFGVPFNAAESFPKMSVSLIAPDGKNAKLEFLGSGQQFVALGTHPDTGEPYRWTNGDPLTIPADKLQPTTASSARGLMEEACKILLTLGFHYEKQATDGNANGPSSICPLLSPLPSVAGPDDGPLDLREALRWCDPVNYGSWIAVSHALKRAELDGATWAYGLWRSWSEHGPFNAEQDDDARWKTFRPSRTGVGAIFKAAAHARALACREPIFAREEQCAGSPAPIVRATEVRAEPISWAWRHRLAYGKLHLVAGRPSTAKSTIALDLAARMSSGQTWPDGTQAEAKNVVIWSGEDDYADTIKPRLMAAGANLLNVYFVSGLLQGRDAGPNGARTRPFDPSVDMDVLERRVEEIGNVGMIIIDSIMSTTRGDSHKNAEVRQDLQPLIDMLSRTGAVGIGITHFTKGTEGRDPIERVTASIAFAAMARLIFATVKQKDAVNDFRVVVAKSNLGPEGGGYRYRVDVVQVEEDNNQIEATRINWGSRLDGDARKLLAEAEGEPGGRSPEQFKEACNLLRKELASGRLPVLALRKAAEAHGVGWRTVQRAKKAVGVVSLQPKKPGPWHWELDRTFHVEEIEDEPPWA